MTKEEMGGHFQRFLALAISLFTNILKQTCKAHESLTDL